MTFKFTRPALAIALALTLAACGGKASYTVGGAIDGLKYSGLVLTTNGMDVAVQPNATSYTFPNSLSYGDVYEVTVKHDPDHQSCAVLAPKDSAGRLATISVPVKCGLIAHTIGGKITGLTTAGLVLTNGSDGTVSPAANDVAFTFSANPVSYGVTYGVSVKTQPANAFCSVTGGNGSGKGTSNPNGTGTMDEADVADLLVTCVSTQS